MKYLEKCSNTCLYTYFVKSFVRYQAIIIALTIDIAIVIRLTSVDDFCHISNNIPLCLINSIT